jgi:hypothetical protein
VTVTDPFNHPDMGQKVDAKSAAEALGDIFRLLGTPGGGQGSSDPFSAAQTTQPTQQSTTQTAAPPAGQPTGTGDHASPVPEGTGVSQGFGVSNDHESGHPGIDFAVPLDTQLLAAASGTVTVASNADPGGYGLYVEIQTPDGFTLRYGHLHNANVKVGDQVHAGQVIGQSGGEANGPNSGNSTGAHLHFEVRKDGQAIDPTPFLAGGYTIVGGPASSPEPATADPKALAAVALKNVIAGLTGKPMQQDPTAQTQDPTQQQGTSDLKPGDMDSYFKAVLQRLGLPVTDANLKFMRAWQKAEGGDETNPFNTTQDAPGASNFNSVGVKRYPDMATGVNATVQTLSNGLYENILAALRAGNDPLAVANALANSPWGTGPLVRQILGGG